MGNIDNNLISRQAAIRIAEQGQVQGYEWQFKELNKLPPVNPQPKTGHWIVNEWGNISCSECGCTALYDKVYPGKSVFGKAIRVKTTFCPTCGARMIESQGSEVQE